MPTSCQYSRTTLKSARLHLGKSLLRLSQRLDRSRRADALHEQRLTKLQSELSGLGERISASLKALESEMELAFRKTPRTRRLNVVGIPAEI